MRSAVFLASWFIGILRIRWGDSVQRRTTSRPLKSRKSLTRLIAPAIGRARVFYFRPAAFRPFCSAAKDCEGAGISQRKPFSSSSSTLFASTCGWPHGIPASLRDRQGLVDRRGDLRVVVLARIAHVLREVALADQHDADPRHLLQHLRQVADRALLLAHDDDEDFALGVQGPGVGPFVIGLLVDAPIARGVARRVAALPRG